MDGDSMRETEAQLETWGAEIARRAAVLAPVARKVRFAVLQHVDELKVLHAVARARFAALTAADAEGQDDLEQEFIEAWNELAAAVGKPLPH
ncbi:MAG: hypothetical protein R6X35_11035 [Candidatus Krumholzibacteriia bacterium]